MSSGFFSKRNVAIIFGAALVVMVVIVAVASGLGHDNVAKGDIAVVDGKGISEDEFNHALELSAKQSGLKTTPQPGDPQYDTTRDQAVGLLLDIAWIEGEAERQGVTVTDTEVQQQFQTTKQQNFKTDQAYQQFLQQSGLTEQEVLDRVKLQLISQKIQDKITQNAEPVSDSDVEDFYDANKSQFQQPAQGSTPAKQLGLDDQAPSSTGGQTLTVRDQIKQQLESQAQQAAFSDFLSDYRDRWTDVTVCADDFLIERCSNDVVVTDPARQQSTAGEVPPCRGDDEKKLQEALDSTGCAPPVQSIFPAAPGSIKPFVPVSGGSPQRPHPPGEDQPAQPSLPGGAIPGGAVPGGAGGAQAPPQSSAPPQQGATP